MRGAAINSIVRVRSLPRSRIDWEGAARESLRGIDCPVTMAVGCPTCPPVLTQASWLLKLFLASLILLALAIVLISPLDFFVLPLVFAPPLAIVYFAYWRVLRPSPPEPVSDELTFRMLAAGCLPGTLCALAIETVLALLFGALCFGAAISAISEEIARKQAFDPSYAPTKDDYLLGKGPAYYAYLFLTAFVVAAATEEGIKTAMVRYPCCGCAPERALCLQRPDPRPKHYARATVSTLLAVSCGFSLAENLIYVFASGMGSTADRLLLALARGLLSTPVHALCAAFTGLRLAMRDSQRRARDTALLRAASASGMQQFAVLPSGVSVAIRSPPASGEGGSPSFPPGTTFAGMPAELTGGPRLTAPPTPLPTGAAAPLVMEQAQQAQMVPVSALLSTLYAPAVVAVPTPEAVGLTNLHPIWSWASVIGPAILIHGVYDFVALLLGELAEKDETASLALSILSAAIIVIVASWALASQFKAAFPTIEAGEVPPNFACAPVWWPQHVRRVAAALCGVTLPEVGWPGASGSSWGVQADEGFDASTWVRPAVSEGLPSAGSYYPPPAGSRPAEEESEESAPLVTTVVQ